MSGADQSTPLWCCSRISGLIPGVPPASLVLAAIFPRRSGPYVVNQESHALIVGGVEPQ